jgi:hypothetical protein
MSLNNQQKFKREKYMLGDKFRALLKKNSETIDPLVKDQIKRLHYTILSSNASKNEKSNALTTLDRYFVKYGVGSVFDGGRRTKHTLRKKRSARKTRRHSRRA